MGRGRMEERLALRNKPFLGEQIHMYMIFDSLSFFRHPIFNIFWGRHFENSAKNFSKKFSKCFANSANF
jgi:hypothetical protein